MGADWGPLSPLGYTSSSDISYNVTVTPEVPKYKTFDDAIFAIANEVASMVCVKQADYGIHNILDSPVGAEKGILVRLWDKFARLKNLIINGKEPQNETKIDTYRDIIGYSLVAIMVDKGWFTLPLERETSKAQENFPEGRS